MQESNVAAKVFQHGNLNYFTQKLQSWLVMARKHTPREQKKLERNGSGNYIKESVIMVETKEKQKWKEGFVRGRERTKQDDLPSLFNINSIWCVNARSVADLCSCCCWYLQCLQLPDFNCFTCATPQTFLL